MFSLEFPSPYELIYYFFIYSILGWTMETTLNFIKHKTFVNRGFLTGCYCPIYGVGMCCIYLFCMPFSNFPFAVFIVGLVVATTIEYITGMLMEKLFHASWWDYSHLKYNLNGKICLRISFAWGVLAVIFTCHIHPLFTLLVNKIPDLPATIMLVILSILFIIDCISSTLSAFRLSTKLPALDLFRSELSCLLEQSKNYLTTKEFKKWTTTYITRLSLLELMETLKLHLRDMGDTSSKKLHQAISALHTKYIEQIGKYSLGEKRLLRAFPHLSLMHHKKVHTSKDTSSSKKENL